MRNTQHTAANDALNGWVTAWEAFEGWHGLVRPTACDNSASESALLVADGHMAGVNLPVHVAVPVGLAAFGVVGLVVEPGEVSGQHAVRVQRVKLLNGGDGLHGSSLRSGASGFALAGGKSFGQCVNLDAAHFGLAAAELGNSRKADVCRLAKDANVLPPHRLQDLPEGFGANSLVHLWIVLQ